MDIHHTNEDIGIVLGDAFKQALGDNIGIKRFGSISVPMEDVVANVVVDISGRGFFNGIKAVAPKLPKIQKDKGYSFGYANYFFEAFAKRVGMNLYISISSWNPD